MKKKIDANVNVIAQFQTLRNLYTMLIHARACLLLKMMCVAFIAHLQRHKKEFDYVTLSRQ